MNSNFYICELQNLLMTKVMIVENSERPLWSVKQLLAAINYDVVFETGNGYEAVEKYDLIKPDLVFVDLNPSKNDGLSIIQEIKNKHAESKIIIMSKQSNSKILNDCMSAGAIDCITTPIKMKEFVSFVTSIDRSESTKPTVAPVLSKEN